VFQYFPSNYMWSAGLNRIMSSGGLIGEIDQAGRELAPIAEQNDDAAWYAAFTKLGAKVQRQGERELAQDHPRSASDTLLRACIYFQWAAAFLPGGDPRKHEAHQQSVDLCKQACALFEPPLEWVEVPYEGSSFPAIYVPPRGVSGPAPAVIFLPGLDSAKEQGLSFGLTLAERGMAVLLPDTPGTGEALFFRKQYARHDYEVPVTAALETLLKRPEVDPSRIAISGVSLGGYYAPRAAAFEPRFAACVAWGAIWDYREIWERRRVVDVTSPVPSPRHQLTLVTGTPDFEAGLRELEKWRLAGVAERIQCPFLVTHGEDDRQIPLADAYKLYEAVGVEAKEIKVFTREEGGASHCPNDNRVLGAHYVADWLEDTLIKGKRRSGVVVG
jgi:fermentation-respiration switch protein FrsA (DUF1100 family)